MDIKCNNTLQTKFVSNISIDIHEQWYMYMDIHAHIHFNDV